MFIQETPSICCLCGQRVADDLGDSSKDLGAVKPLQMVPQARVELATYRLGGGCSILLSY